MWRALGTCAVGSLMACGGSIGGQSAPGEEIGGADAGTPLAETCVPPDMLIVLDRSESMLGDLAGDVPITVPESRWAMAVGAVESLMSTAVVRPSGTPVDRLVRFGLELFPEVDPACVTVPAYIAGGAPANPTCEAPQIPVPTALSTAAAVQEAVDPDTTALCSSAPLSRALETAGEHLAGTAANRGERILVLVTDGVDVKNSACEGTDVSGAPEVLITVQRLAAEHQIRTYIVGFGPEFDSPWVAANMNDLACAGMTDPNPDANCADGFDGLVTAPLAGDTLYRYSPDGLGLVDLLRQVVGESCCDCELL